MVAPQTSGPAGCPRPAGGPVGDRIERWIGRTGQHHRARDAHGFHNGRSGARIDAVARAVAIGVGEAARRRAATAVAILTGIASAVTAGASESSLDDRAAHAGTGGDRRQEHDQREEPAPPRTGSRCCHSPGLKRARAYSQGRFRGNRSSTPSSLPCAAPGTRRRSGGARDGRGTNRCRARTGTERR